MDVGYMIVNGRNPEDKNTFIIEHVCQFFMYITKGQGIVYAGDEKLEVRKKDLIFIPTNAKFAVEGKFEYVTIDNPAFFIEHSEEIKE